MKGMDKILSMDKVLRKSLFFVTVIAVYKKEFKEPNPGKPANNNDPFPVDLKIEELETHKPTVKIHTITCCPEAVPVAKAVINVSDRAEKRIVKQLAS